jgi:hypothetical protein
MLRRHGRAALAITVALAILTAGVAIAAGGDESPTAPKAA